MARAEAFLTTTAPLAGSNPYLMGNFRPVVEETVRTGPFTVEGAIPPDLNGLLLRNGPNPAVVQNSDTYHWFSGDGMLHGLELRDGALLGYRNRFVRTRMLADEIGTMSPRGPREAINGPANTNVISFANRILVLVESGLPHRMTPDLETVCVEDFDGTLASPMTAHPKIDPETGAMAAFGYDPFGPPYLRYHEITPEGKIVWTTAIDLPSCVMIHDAMVSATQIGFFDLPVGLDTELAMAGVALPFRFDPEGRSRVGLLDRGTPGERVQWLSVEPCYVFHVVNAFDDGADLVADLYCYDRTFDTGMGRLLGSALPRLERWRMSPTATAVHRTVLDDLPAEFPRIDDAMAGRPYAHGYATQIARRDGLDAFPGYVKINADHGTVARIDLPDHLQASEPIFVRASDGKTDEEGWLLAVEYDRTSDSSDLVIYDAHAFSAKPEARIHLPVRIPFGFHGAYLDAGHFN